MLTAGHPDIQRALAAWREYERRNAINHGLADPWFDDTYKPKHAHTGGTRWLRLDRGDSGAYLIDKTSEMLDVYTIKAYGVPNNRICSLEEMILRWETRSWLQH